MTQNDQNPLGGKHEVALRVEEFLQSVEKKTDDEVHRRILRACRQGDPTTCVEEELEKVIKEILHET